VGDVHSVSHDEQIRAFEADVVGLERLGKLAGFIEEDGHRGLPRSAFLHELLRKSDRAPRFEDVVDDQDVAPRNVAFDVPDQRHLAGRGGAGAVARQRQELDLRCKPRQVEGANEVRGENEAALEDRDDEEIAISGSSDFRGQLNVAL
jgi:hypothetical protein